MRLLPCWASACSRSPRPCRILRRRRTPPCCDSCRAAASDRRPGQSARKSPSPPRPRNRPVERENMGESTQPRVHLVSSHNLGFIHSASKAEIQQSGALLIKQWGRNKLVCLSSVHLISFLPAAKPARQWMIISVLSFRDLGCRGI